MALLHAFYMVPIMHGVGSTNILKWQAPDVQECSVLLWLNLYAVPHFVSSSHLCTLRYVKIEVGQSAQPAFHHYIFLAK